MQPGDDEAELLAMHRIAAVRRRRLGYLASSGDELARARQLAAGTGREDLLVDLVWDAFAAASTACDFQVAEDRANELLALGDATLEPAVEAAGQGAWGVIHLQRSEIGLAAERLDRAVALGRGLEPGKGTLGLTEYLLLTASYAEIVHQLADDPIEEKASLRALARRQTEPYQRLIVGMFGALGHSIAGDAARAEEAARAALAAIPAAAFPFYAAATEILLGAALVERGEIEEGLGLIETGGRRYRNPHVRTIVPYYVSLRALAWARAGEVERGLGDAAAASRLLAASQERWPEAFLLIDEAEIRRLGGERARSIAPLLRQARSIAEAQGVRAGVRRAAERAERLGVRLE
jgi:hypothetical protein